MSDPIEYNVKVYANGHKRWFRNGKNHREDGPAIEYAKGSNLWYLEGRNYTEEEFKAKMNAKKNPCNGKVIEIDGKKYKLVEEKS